MVILMSSQLAETPRMLPLDVAARQRAEEVQEAAGRCRLGNQIPGLENHRKTIGKWWFNGI